MRIVCTSSDGVYVAPGPDRPAISAAPGDELEVDDELGAALVAQGAFAAAASTSKRKTKKQTNDTPAQGEGDTAA